MQDNWFDQERKRCRDLLSGELILLAGPIARRCEASGLAFFVATNRQVDVVTHVYALDKNGKRGKELGVATVSSRKIGARLYVTIAQARPDPRVARQFPVGVPIGYDMEFIADPERAPASTPVALDRLAQQDLNYGPLELPTVILGTPDRPTFAHASCRKFHGDGLDAMARLDDRLREAVSNSAGVARPSALLLTGDQIYADDVPEPLIDTLMALGEALMGYDERIPTRDGSMSAMTCTRLRCGSRALRLQVWKKRAFTSGLQYGRNQLMGFGEFAAAYVLAWGTVCWPRELPDRSPCFNGVEKPTQLTPPYSRQLQLVESYQRSVPSIRRALANISTYQIMDDHEVTDDWNLNGQWFDRVQADACARRVVSNAMAAYWCFQAQGNDPRTFSINDVFDKYIDAIRRGDASASAGAESRDWTFVTPTLPPVLVLNTRTQRDFGERKDWAKPPGLMRREAMDAAKQAYLKSAPTPQWPALVVSPVPVLGPQLLEAVQAFSVYTPWPDVIDPEAWSLNERSFAYFLWTLRALTGDACVILSGDVHYGCVMMGVYSSPPLPPVRYIQFTSSGTRNASSKSLGPPMRGVSYRIFSKRRDDPALPDAVFYFGFAGTPSKPDPTLPLANMVREPNPIWDRNVGILSLESNGDVTCEFLTFDDRGRPGSVLVTAPKESARLPVVPEPVPSISVH